MQHGAHVLLLLYVAQASRCPMQDDLAANVTLEQGKTIADAHGDVFRGVGERFAACYPHSVHL